jgi:signal recognition particle GTPase
MVWLVGDVAAFDSARDLGDRVIARIAGRTSTDESLGEEIVKVRRVLRGLDPRDADAVAAAVDELRAWDAKLPA